ncbi:TlpA family protein disulfide reductase [Nocardioides gilvus]|uniref:TlpA family protein disulfide reductase n=1 Tax=Nocardioides gilvus TaxID=1735589 RepID=UPI001EF3EB14|nr:TlpA disulfide reductase family protein [Nocardioides gilvus]
MSRTRRTRRTPHHLRVTLAPLVAALACLLALSGCSSLSGTGDKDYVSGDGTLRRIAVDEREAPIEFAGEDLDGEPLDLADLRGKPVVVNVWWSACPPCRKEMPYLVEASERTSEIANFVGINIRDGSTSQAKGFVRKFDVPYPSFFSPDGKALLPFSGTLPPNAIPSTVVLDAEGRVAASIIGEVPSTLTLVNLVEDVAGAKAKRG